MTTIETIQAALDDHDTTCAQGVVLCGELLDSGTLDEQDERRIALLFWLLENDNRYTPEDIEPTAYDDCLFQVNIHAVYCGTSPATARKLAALVRKALQAAVDSLPSGDRNANRMRDRLAVPIFVHRDPSENNADPGLRLLSRDVSTWTVKDLADAQVLNERIKAGHCTPDQLGSLGIESESVPLAFIPTYGACCELFREACPELLKEGIHDLVNSLYCLSPLTNGYDHTKNHRDTLREAFDGKTIKDRRTRGSDSDGEYLVLTDDEADERQDDSFENLLDDGGCVPGADSPYFDRDKWKRDAKIDGRGHSLAMYDGCEQDCREFYIYRTN